MPAIAKPAFLNGLMLSQADLIKRLDPKGNVADIAEILNDKDSDITFDEYHPDDFQVQNQVFFHQFQDIL